jgi:hypothetical protein
MTPYAAIAEKYRAIGQAAQFTRWQEWHKEHGFLFATPDFFIMGRPVIRGAPLADDAGNPIQFDRRRADAWFINCMAGDMHRAWSIMPWPLEWIGFCRVRFGEKELHFVPTATLMRLCTPTHEMAQPA